METWAFKSLRAGQGFGSSFYLRAYLLGAAAGAAFGVAVLLLFFTCDLAVLLLVVAVGVAAGVVFCTFLAAGAAIRKGTAAIVSRVEVNSVFIVFSPSTSGRLFVRISLPLTSLLCLFLPFRAIASKRDFRSRILGIAAGKS